MNGYTKADNWLWDYVMPKAKPNTFKVVSAILRLTAGWHRDQVEISYRELQEVTGISSRTTLINAIEDALKEGFITRHEAGRSFIYGTDIVPIDGTEMIPTRYRNDTDIGTEMIPTNGTKPVPPQSSTNNKEKEKENINGSPGHPVWQLPDKLNTDNFEDAWILWYRHREDIDEPLTQVAGEVMLRELEGMGEGRAIRAIKHSVARGWKNIYEPSPSAGLNGASKHEHVQVMTDESGGAHI